MAKARGLLHGVVAEQGRLYRQLVSCSIAAARNWGMISTQNLGWVDLRPVALSVQGDIAVLHFYGLRRAPDGDAEVVTEAKRTEVLRRVEAAPSLAPR